MVLRNNTCKRRVYSVTVLKAQGLTKDYATPAGPIRILEDIHLTLERGDAIAVTGPSGSGKSTLLYLFGALDRPTSGTVWLDETDVSALGEPEQATFRNRNIGFVFQDHALLPQCTLVENILVPALVSDGGAAARTARARTLIEAVGLAHRMDHKPGQLSGGERQRVAIARALIMQPPVLLCDEPTGNLDSDTAATVADVLFRLHDESPSVLVVVTHSMDLASRFPVRYALKNRGLVRV
jgi:lipoprotein-releasing system ATP-binding protein